MSRCGHGGILHDLPIHTIPVCTGFEDDEGEDDGLGGLRFHGLWKLDRRPFGLEVITDALEVLEGIVKRHTPPVRTSISWNVFVKQVEIG